MDVEIITIGDEILSGHTIDSNSAAIAIDLAAIGLKVKYKTAVGDAVEQMEEAFRMALKRARIVITTGGLGPTDDDITKKAITKVFKRNLIFHEDVLEDIKARYAKRGIDMPAINQNQALLPQGATFFPNRLGSAVGICIAEEGRVFISLPGVPREMKQIMTDGVVPYLSQIKGAQAISVVTLRTTGIVESKVAEMIKENLKLPDNTRLAYLPSYGGVSLRVTASADEKEIAEKHTRDVVSYLESVIGQYIFGQNNDTLEAVVGQLLVDNDKTVAVAESCTGGKLGELLTSVSGSSRYFMGGMIAYDNDIKIEKLGVDKQIIVDHGAVSEECAIAMAAAARNLFETGYALSITGVAGPEGGTDDKPVGTVFIGLVSPHTQTAKRFLFGTDREINRTRACYAALEMLRREILDIN